MLNHSITFCLPSRSNLRYLKDCIPSIRRNLSSRHDIILFIDEDNDGTREWASKNKDIYNFKVIENPYINKRRFGIGPAYDACIKEATTDVVMIAHADMIFARGLDDNILAHIEPGTVVAATRIEPPNYPNAGEKIQQSFGQYPEDFNHEKFEEFVDQQLSSQEVTEGIFAPWALLKSDYEKLGGHDARLHSCREDSDLFNRMLLAGFKFVQPWNALVWHYGGRGAGSNQQFDNEEDRIRHENWKKDMNNSTREFIRKWKSQVKHEPLMKPIVNPIYNTAIKITNCNPQLLGALEPLADDIYVDCEIREYIEKEQYNTSENLINKIHDHSEEPDNDVVISIDGRAFTQQDYQIMFEMGAILKQSGQIGKSKLGQFNIEVEIKRLEEKQNEFIKIL